MRRKRNNLRYVASVQLASLQKYTAKMKILSIVIDILSIWLYCSWLRIGIRQVPINFAYNLYTSVITMLNQRFPFRKRPLCSAKIENRKKFHIISLCIMISEWNSKMVKSVCGYVEIQRCNIFLGYNVLNICSLYPLPLCQHYRRIAISPWEVIQGLWNLLWVFDPECDLEALSPKC